MWFQVLGPLGVTAERGPVQLGGLVQRATLGYLLLRANEVVPTSRLLEALWTVDELPVTARKILQNSIWALRKRFTECGGPQGPSMLLTEAPGYRLVVDPEHVDLHLYNKRTHEGRAALERGEPELAAGLLRDALGLWRGQVLADLVEAGKHWPETAAIQNARLDVMEDCFEAELACGRHQVIIRELEELVAQNPPRERACGQLMRALYHSGRQADALNVYGRTRVRLVEEFGLEPGHQLQQLQRAILSQELEPEPRRETAVVTSPAPRVLTPDVPTRDGLTRDGLTRDGLTRDGLIRAGLIREEPGALVPVAQKGVGRNATEWRRLTAVLVRVRLTPKTDEACRGKFDEVLEATCGLLRERVERFGGTVVTSFGSLWLAVFEHGPGREDHAERAVRSALMIRQTIAEREHPATRHASAFFDLGVRVAVVTGEARLRYRPDGSRSAEGALLDECEALLARVPADEIDVCSRTHQETESRIAYRHVCDSPFRWRVDKLYESREHEVDLLCGVLERTILRSVPRLVTVLGASDVDRTQLFADFGLQVWRQFAGKVRFFSARASARIAEAETVEKVLMLQEGGGHDGEKWTVSYPHRFVTPNGFPAASHTGLPVPSFQRFLEDATLDGPLVVVVDDLHHAEDRLLDLIEQLVDSGEPVPLLIVAGASPELLEKRPGLVGGKRRTITITIESSSLSAA